MKRIWILAVLLLVLGGGAFLLNKNKKDPNTTINRAESNFRVEDPNTIGSIIITNKNGSRSILKRVGDHWTINDDHKARQSTINILLEGIQRQSLDHIPSRAATENILTTMGVSGIHVDIFDSKGEPLLSYTVGGVTQDEYGTFFLKDGSAQPYCLVQPGFSGSLRARYALSPLDWRDVRFWMEENDKIDTLTVDYPHQHQHAFVIIRNGNGYDVKPLYATTPLLKGANSNIVKSYLTTLSGLACEDFLNDIPEKDSILRLEPFMDMRISYPDKTSRLRFYPVGTVQQSEFSPAVPRYYIEYENRDFMISQFEVIKGAFRSYDYFFSE